MIRFFSALLAVFLLSFAVHAEEQVKLDSAQYSPDYCQFTSTFPEEPYKTHRCESDSTDTCYDLISYTKTFELSSSIRVEIICNPSTPSMYKQFTQDVMESTVRAMTKSTVIEAFEVGSHQADGYRHTGLLGKGRKGLDDTIYIAQLWVAQNSIMSVEAELIGEQSQESDELFAEILSNIKYIGNKAAEEKAE